MDGMTMLMRQMGIDPEKIKQALTDARDQIMREVKEIKDAQARIELQVQLLASLLKENGFQSPETNTQTECGMIDAEGDYKKVQ